MLLGSAWLCVFVYLKENIASYSMIQWTTMMSIKMVSVLVRVCEIDSY